MVDIKKVADKLGMIEFELTDGECPESQWEELLNCSVDDVDLVITQLHLYQDEIRHLINEFHEIKLEEALLGDNNVRY